jgi:hypothetical protein
VIRDRSRESSTRDASLSGGRPAGDTGHARWRLRALALASVGALVALGGALAPLAPAQQPQEQEISLLFAQTANRGTMKPIKGPTPRFNLKLFGVNPQVVWFSDRPARQSGQIAVPDFTRSWPGFGFVDDPPNAALTLLDAGNRHDTVVMELGRPHFKQNKNRVRYSARLLDEATGDLSYLNSDLDPRVKRHFMVPSLFIDDAAARVVNGCRIAPFTVCPRANLSGADLSRANLTGADLSGADLSSADLVFANLSGADLPGTDLSGASLSRANLFKADLRAADLTGTNLNGAHFCRTTMPNGSINDRHCGDPV